MSNVLLIFLIQLAFYGIFKQLPPAKEIISGLEAAFKIPRIKDGSVACMPFDSRLFITLLF